MLCGLQSSIKFVFSLNQNSWVDLNSELFGDLSCVSVFVCSFRKSWRGNFRILELSQAYRLNKHHKNQSSKQAQTSTIRLSTIEIKLDPDANSRSAAALQGSLRTRSVKLSANATEKTASITRSQKSQQPNIPRSTRIVYALVLVLLVGIVQLLSVRTQEWFSDNETASKIKNKPTDHLLLLASHGRLVWYNLDLDTVHVLHQGAGVYYGAFFGTTIPEPIGHPTVWVSVRRDSAKKKDILLHLDAITGEEINAIDLPSRFTHDTIRSSDGRYVLVADTSTGSIEMYNFPKLKHLKHFDLFTRDDHINTLCTTAEGTIWAMLHRRGKSRMVEFDPATGSIITDLQDVGEHAHGLVAYGEGERLILSSKEMALVRIRVTKGEKYDLGHKEVLWQYNGTGKFLKGLAVVDNVAYFGISKMESRLGRARVDCSLVAFDLVALQLLWVRASPGTLGLINTISAPQLGTDSTCRPQQWQDMNPELNPLSQQRLVNAVHTRSVSKSSLIGLEHDKSLESELSNECISNYMGLLENAKMEGHAYGTTKTAFYELPLRFDIEQLQREVKWLYDSFDWTLRADVNNYFVLLVTREGGETDQSTYGPFSEVPGRLSQTPYIRQVLDSFRSIVGRARLMMIPANSSLTPHQDRTSHVFGSQPKGKQGYWGRRFRVHIPVFSDPQVQFVSEGTTIHMNEGRAYLFDNSRVHSVTNPSSSSRIHLIFDTVGSAELYNMIQDSKWIDQDRSLKETKRERWVEPSTVRETMIVTEQWYDANVFEPMKVHQVNAFLSTYVGGMLDVQQTSVRVIETIKALFLDFENKWSAQLRNRGATASRFKFLGEKLIRDVVEIECKEGKIHLQSDAGASSLTLSNVIDNFARMLYYECTGWPKKMIVDSSRGPLCFNGIAKRD